MNKYIIGFLTYDFDWECDMNISLKENKIGCTYQVVRFAADTYAAHPIVVGLDPVDIAPAQEGAVPTTLAVDIVLDCSALLDLHYFANLL